LKDFSRIYFFKNYKIITSQFKRGFYNSFLILKIKKIYNLKLAKAYLNKQ